MVPANHNEHGDAVPEGRLRPSHTKLSSCTWFPVSFSIITHMRQDRLFGNGAPFPVHVDLKRNIIYISQYKTHGFVQSYVCHFQRSRRPFFPVTCLQMSRHVCSGAGRRTIQRRYLLASWSLPRRTGDAKQSTS